MKVKSAPPSQRRHHRLSAPLYVTFNGQDRIKADNWSLGGLTIAKIKGKLPRVGRSLNLGLTLPFQGYDISFDAEVKVVRKEPKLSLIGCEFTDLSERSRDLLEYFCEDLIRGHMGTVEDSICRIDMPVTPISTEPSPNHISEVPVRRLPIRTLIMSIAYILIGLFVFSHVGILIFSNFVKLEVASSVVSSQLQTLKMPMDGTIRQVNYKEGDLVKQGDNILIINDRKLESQINVAKLKVATTKKSLWKLKQRHRIEKERLELYQIVSRTDKNIAIARLSSLRVALNAADEHFVRMTKLKKSGAVTASLYEEAKTKQALAASEVREAELLLEKNSAMSATSNRRHYNHKEFVVDLDLLAVDLEMAYSALEMDERKLQYLIDIRQEGILRAPFDGKIVNLYHSNSANVIRNEPLLLFERDDQTTVTAYLNQSEILEIGLHDEARIFIPAIDKRLSAVVTKIDRNSLFRNRNSTQYTWRDEKERTAVVTLRLRFDNPNQSQITAGLPVVVIFNRWETSDIWSSIKGFVGIKQKLEHRHGSHQEI